MFLTDNIKAIIILIGVNLGVISNCLTQVHIDHLGNLGIGTNQPQEKLQLGSFSIPGDNYISISTVGGYAYKAGIKLQHFQQDCCGYKIESNEITNKFSIIRQESSLDLHRLTIDFFGNIGIGSTNPTQKLDINGKLRVRDIAQNNETDSILVSSGDGTLAYRDLNSLPGSDCNLAIGDTIYGGIIFYLDPSGCHGLVCAPEDQSAGIVWIDENFRVTRTHADGIGTGYGNSLSIRWALGDCNSCYANEVCWDLTLNGYSDWYLPSRYELNLMFHHVGPGNALGLGNIAGFAEINPISYWTSNESVGDFSQTAWGQNMLSGATFHIEKNSILRVRAVRAF